MSHRGKWHRPRGRTASKYGEGPACSASMQHNRRLLLPYRLRRLPVGISPSRRNPSSFGLRACGGVWSAVLGFPLVSNRSIDAHDYPRTFFGHDPCKWRNNSTVMPTLTLLNVRAGPVWIPS